MTIPAALAALAGQWTGTNHVWLDPSKPSRDSATTLSVATAAQGRFVTLQYTWADEGQPQDGLLVLGQTPDGVARATWIDSWHMGDLYLVLTGALDAAGRASLKGSYAATSGPDWGWQIAVAALPDGRLQIVMHNVTPDGEAQLAVEATYAR